MNTEKAVNQDIKRTWYNNYTFPLIPTIKSVKADEHNTHSFLFHWLVFKFWTLDSFSFEISFVITSHWGIGFIGILPYLRWAIAIPFPENAAMWSQKYLWRKPKED